MRYTAYLNVPNFLFKNVPALTKMLVQEHDWQRLKSLSMGVRLMSATVTTGLNGDDFVRDRRTILIQYKAFKIPRFLKTSLIKKFKSTDTRKSEILVEEILKHMN